MLTESHLVDQGTLPGQVQNQGAWRHSLSTEVRRERKNLNLSLNIPRTCALAITQLMATHFETLEAK